MRIDIERMHDAFHTAQRGKASEHSAAQRLEPSRWRYDYLTLRTLAEDVESLLRTAGRGANEARALDVGACRSPYRPLIESLGYELSTLDLTLDDGADYAGPAENMPFPDGAFDLVVCTQVLEHTDQPWRAVGEIRRVLKPGGHAVLSAPHVWFFHPHPSDNWRFTQEGLVRLCVDGGLEPVELRGQGGTIVTIAQIANFLFYGAFGKFGAPAFFVTNVVAPWVDRVMPNTLFCHNFACLARRPTV